MLLKKKLRLRVSLGRTSALFSRSEMIFSIILIRSVSGSAVAKGNNAVVLGAESVANVDGSVALGAFSKADRGPEQEDGYDPFGEAHDGSPTWRATAAAVSV